MLKNLLDNLHPAINKDAKLTNAISITASNGVAYIKDNILQLTGSSSAQYNLRSYTLGSLVTAINGQTGFSATLSQSTFLSAVVLVDGTYTGNISIPMFTSMLWQLLKPIALTLIDALAAQNQSLLEMILTTADGSWLDAFGELFGVIRQNGELDQLYSIRIFDFSVAPRINNFAIQKTLHDLQYNATITDGVGSTFNVSVILPSNPPSGYIYTTLQLRQLIDLIRPAGVSYGVISQGSMADNPRLTDSVTVSTVMGMYGSMRKWGQGVWGM
jgi:hypothetical protein